MSEHQQFTLALARQQGEEGMQRAMDRAERDDRGILDVMYAFLVKYAVARKRTDRFGAEDVTIAFREDASFDHPVDDRSWGGVFRRAQNRAVITIAEGTGIRRRGHGTKGGTLWRSLVCGRRWSEFDFAPPKRSRRKQ